MTANAGAHALHRAKASRPGAAPMGEPELCRFVTLGR